MLADEVNVGYHGWSNLLLKSVNDFEPKNIQELVDIIARKLEGEMVEFRCQMVGLEEADFGEMNLGIRYRLNSSLFALVFILISLHFFHSPLYEDARSASIRTTNPSPPYDCIMV